MGSDIIYKVFFIQAFEQMDPNGSLKDVVGLELIDTTYEKALSRAKKIIKKNYYRLSGVIEKYK